MHKYQIKTDRLGMRLLQMSDLDLIAELNADPEVRKFFPDGVVNRKQTAERMREFISFYDSMGLPCFVIFDLETGEFIGRCGFGPIETGEIEVGYLIRRKFWNQGYASEALKALLDWAKGNIDADYIIAFTPTEHRASQRVMQKCGMKYYKVDIGHGLQCCFYRMKNR
ncbi:hypothetical protein AQUSIP_06500 [Aquicella siphonis]|uniref:N-acetyltransferase domain-containing protein n=1 Tax=Aquicella siphonis TaxID=254247 RepID=A0A5E4PEG5_9COXI|nr:GNAT family N-acetyltransferase [Aquicella siphonis]VVC75360.1 hypothetical protein AQUSIP_06500 [Aquicella siphonis]